MNRPGGKRPGTAQERPERKTRWKNGMQVKVPLEGAYSGFDKVHSRRLFRHLVWAHAIARTRLRSPSHHEILELLFRDAMDTHNRLPDNDRARLSSMRSSLPDPMVTKAEIYELELSRLKDGMSSHDGNARASNAGPEAMDRMIDVLDLLRFVRGRDWRRLRKLVLLRAGGGTLEQCSRFWNRDRPCFSRQYLHQLLGRAYGQIMEGLRLQHAIHRQHSGFRLMIEDDQ